MTINAKQIEQTDSCRWIAEASDLGLKTGVWPDTIRVTGFGDLGDHALVFRKIRSFMHNEELGGYEYRSDQNVCLTVFND